RIRHERSCLDQTEGVSHVGVGNGNGGGGGGARAHLLHAGEQFAKPWFVTASRNILDTPGMIDVSPLVLTPLRGGEREPGVEAVWVRAGLVIPCPCVDKNERVDAIWMHRGTHHTDLACISGAQQDSAV